MAMQFNQEKAIEGSSTSNSLQAGMNAVRITQAYQEISEGKGTVGLHLDFEDKAKKKGRIRMWITKADGEPIFGGSQAQAIMAVCGMQSFSDQPGDHFEYDFETKEDIVVPGINHPEFENKYFQILLKKEPYESQTGEWKYRLELAGAYHMKTMQSAGEFLTNKEATQHKNDTDYANQQSEKAEAKIEQMNAQRNNSMSNNGMNGGMGGGTGGDPGFNGQQQNAQQSQTADQGHDMPKGQLDSEYGF